jgi:hypothetical protein
MQRLQGRTLLVVCLRGWTLYELYRLGKGDRPGGLEQEGCGARSRPRFPLPPTGFSGFTQHLKCEDETVSTPPHPDAVGLILVIHIKKTVG